MTTAHVPGEGILIGRGLVPGHTHPRILTVRAGAVFDITAKGAATVRDIAEMADPAAHVRAAPGTSIGSVEALLENSRATAPDPRLPRLLSPIDLQAVKAAGVTFVASLLERVIEEGARGDRSKAEALRAEVTALIGSDLSKIEPGSPKAMELKATLIAKGIWSQYLEVGIGPDAEIFTKAQPMSSVGYGADVGLHPISQWNNPEPEIALVISSRGVIVGATLANDVNLRDVEGRSALLLGKAKDNNASAAVGPFVRLVDGDFGLADVERAELTLRITGEDGFVLDGASNMAMISRKPAALAAAAIGPHHQYPDGLILMLGTMFAPTLDRDGPGKGFTHKMGDVVEISTPALGMLMNRVRLSTECSPWTYGTSHLMRDLAAADLL
ncbi:fumarylacetoacetate hydrolase family protein [Methyloraptor flagellatus]|uniref:Fumarylacetoacetate hydrolase family protein n=1 Tax=Methyloraptor flagellatus TaxID=3162530 RepID=A0AAU7X923_9HYPH